MDLKEIDKIDPEVSKYISLEIERQTTTIDLCASANRASKAVLSASGSIFSDKPSEGYAGRRYHGGCQFIDEIEKIGTQRAKDIFGCEHVNLQPHSGSNANLAIFFGFLKPRETVLSMNLQHGGHLSHGFSNNISGTFYNPVFYKTDPSTGYINYDEIEELAIKHKPKMIIAGATSYPRIIDFKRFKSIADKVEAYLLADIAHIGGLVAGGVHPSPFPWCDFAVATNYKTLPGSRGGMILCKSEHAATVDRAVFPGVQGGMIASLITAKTISMKQILMPSFKIYQQQIVNNAREIAAVMIKNGFKLVTGGTDTHLVLVDLSTKNMTGKDAQEALGKAGITLDKNLIPNDKLSSTLTSGIRIGTSSVTSQGMKEAEMKKIAEFITLVLQNLGNEELYTKIKSQVSELCVQFPLDR